MAAAPPPPPPPKRASRLNRQSVIKRAVSSVQAALETANPNLKGQQAKLFAREMLTRPGVSIGRGGNIFYQGKRFAPEAFANSPLGKMATGATARAQNQSAITGDPGYQQALATLGLNRDQATSGLQDQERQALIQFGDPTFAAGDATTGGAAAVNPYSTSRLEAQAYQNQLGALHEQANRFGTLFGGGAISGRNQAQLQYAGQVQDAVTKLQALLSGVQSQTAAAGQAYDVGKSQAATDAYNALLASGAIHAAKPPSWGVGTFRVRPPVNKGVPGFGPTGGASSPFDPGPARGPIVPRPGSGIPNFPGNGRPLGTGPPQPPQPIDMTATLRRYGVGG